MGLIRLCISEIAYTCCTAVAGAVLCRRRREGKGKSLHRHRQIHARDRAVRVRNIVTALVGARRRHIRRRRVGDLEVVVRSTRTIRQAAEVVFACLESTAATLYSRVSDIVTAAYCTVSTQPGQAHRHTIDAGFARILRAVKIIVFVY